MTREEAIKRIKEWNLDDGTMEVLSAAIPELNENNDDRIRRAIINVFATHKGFEVFYGATVNDILSWLKKQGEQKPEEVDNLHNYLYGEQKSAWSEEDKENISMLIDLVESKEESMEVKIELSAWLKSLKDRIQPQSKQEWSEEDEKILNSIIEDVMPCGECPDYPTDEEREYFYEGNRKVDWLKSLKNRITPTNKNDFDRGYDVGISAAQFNQWKPTEEQLEALEWSLGDYRNVIFEERHDTLTSLYNDLKKLKGEK